MDFTLKKKSNKLSPNNTTPAPRPFEFTQISRRFCPSRPLPRSWLPVPARSATATGRLRLLRPQPPPSSAPFEAKGSEERRGADGDPCPLALSLSLRPHRAASRFRRRRIFCSLPHSRSARRRRRRLSGSGPQRRRGSPRLGGGVRGSSSRLSPVASRPRLRPPHTGRRPCVRTSLSPLASAVPSTEHGPCGSTKAVAPLWERLCPIAKRYPSA